MTPEYVNDERQNEYLGALKKLLDDVNAEDMTSVENVFLGLQSNFAMGGHLRCLERPNYEFGQYLTGRLCERAG